MRLPRQLPASGSQRPPGRGQGRVRPSMRPVFDITTTVYELLQRGRSPCPVGTFCKGVGKDYATKYTCCPVGTRCEPAADGRPDCVDETAAAKVAAQVQNAAIQNLLAQYG